MLNLLCGTHNANEGWKAVSKVTNCFPENGSPYSPSSEETAALLRSWCEDLPLPLAHVGDKKVKRFHSVKSLADYHICERP